MEEGTFYGLTMKTPVIYAEIQVLLMNLIAGGGSIHVVSKSLAGKLRHQDCKMWRHQDLLETKTKTPPSEMSWHQDRDTSLAGEELRPMLCKDFKMWWRHWQD